MDECPQCHAQDSLHRARVTDSDVIVEWCDECEYEDA